MRKVKKPAWWKMFGNQRALVKSVSDEIAGKAIKACFDYFEDGEIGELDPLTFAVFSAIKPYIDESYEDYRLSVEMGKKGAAARWTADE